MVTRSCSSPHLSSSCHLSDLLCYHCIIAIRSWESLYLCVYALLAILLSSSLTYNELCFFSSSACKCDKRGTVESQCDQKTGVCRCKRKVKGLTCSQCNVCAVIISSDLFTYIRMITNRGGKMLVNLSVLLYFNTNFFQMMDCWMFIRACIWKDAIGQMGLYCCIVLKLLYISGWILEPWSDAWRLSGLWLWSRRVEKPYMWPRDRTVWLPSSHHGTKMW